MQKLLTFFFSKNIIVYAIFNDQSLNDTFTNDIVSFEQLGPGYLDLCKPWYFKYNRLQWLEYLWDPENLFKTWIVRSTEV